MVSLLPVWDHDPLVCFWWTDMDNNAAKNGFFVLELNEDYICARCSCGQASLVPVNYAVEHGAISCRCGAQRRVDGALIARLSADERLRLERQSLRLASRATA